MENIKYTTLIDFVLVLLRNLRKARPNTYTSLVQLLKVMGQGVSFSEVQELAKYLEAKGWAKIIKPLGDIRAKIKTSGIVYIEEKPAAFNDEYEAFKKVVTEGKVEKDLTVKLYEEQDDPKQFLFSLIDKLKAKIIESSGENDFSKDVDIIKLEMSKLTPDFRLIEVKLNGLINLNFISSEIQELRDYIPQ